MNNSEKELKRCLYNILSAMVKQNDAPCSAEMHLAESVVLLSNILNVRSFEDNELNEQYSYCDTIIKLTRDNIN